MDILSDQEIEEIVLNSKLVPLYNQSIDRNSAYEMLTEKLTFAKEKKEKRIKKVPQTRKRRKVSSKSSFEKMMSSPVVKQVGRTVAREFTRGLLGVLGLGGTTKKRRRKTKSFF
jgi:hypothetical protein